MTLFCFHRLDIFACSLEEITTKQEIILRQADEGSPNIPISCMGFEASKAGIKLPRAN
jgi:hypothetical protein